MSPRAPLWLAVLVAAAGLWLVGAELPLPALGALAALNLLAFTLYALDKARARAGRARVPEAVLHLAGVAGGVGACAGRLFCNHKTRKPAFGVSTWAGALVTWALLFVI